MEAVEDTKGVSEGKVDGLLADTPQDTVQTTVKDSTAEGQSNDDVTQATTGDKGKELSATNETESGDKIHISAHEKAREGQDSSRVKEAQRWNNRDRERGGQGHQINKKFHRNNKSDLTSQAESSDPVAIRKQVRHLHIRL